ncbi:unnamed protein product [Peniophora sp. CBMAI 1063]|nr:unnamed protein product [Peniophora sp. CBMAI 1063]
MSDLSQSAASLVQGWFSSTLCGFNIVLYFFCVRVLFKRSPDISPRARWVLAVSSTAQVMVCFASSAILLAINRHGFVTLGGGQRGEVYFFVPNTPFEVAEECLYTVNDWIGSGVLLWRAYIITSRDWKLCAPLAIVWLGLLATLIGSLRQLTHLPTGSVVFDPVLGNWVLAFTVISLALQLGATGLVAWRIWATINWRDRRSWSREWHALRIVVESGAIYGVLTILSLAFYLARTNIGGINVGIVTQVSATCPYLIILRAHAYREEESRNHRVKVENSRWTWATRGSSSEESGNGVPLSPQGIIPPPDSARTHYTVDVQLPPGIGRTA